jgi:hypothetical protein
MWYPERKTGGQAVLISNDVEKLEEMKNWQLYDHVVDELKDDRDNLLNTQNDIQTLRRYTNNYNSIPQPYQPPPMPNTRSWQHPMTDSRPTAYPMMLDDQYSNGLYPRYMCDRPQYLDQRREMMNNVAYGDLHRVVHSDYQAPYVANDRRYTGMEGKASLLDHFDSRSVSALDIAVVRM